MPILDQCPDHPHRPYRTWPDFDARLERAESLFREGGMPEAHRAALVQALERARAYNHTALHARTRKRIDAAEAELEHAMDALYLLLPFGEVDNSV